MAQQHRERPDATGVNKFPVLSRRFRRRRLMNLCRPSTKTDVWGDAVMAPIHDHAE